MTICDVCKKPEDVLRNEAPPGDALWGIVLSGGARGRVSERRACIPCTMQLFDGWVKMLDEQARARPRPEQVKL